MDQIGITKARLNAGLAIAGAVVGVLVGAALTVLGKMVADAPSATMGNYAWNMGVFGVLGAVLGPVVTWSALRHVPLWRAFVEPMAGAIAGGVAGVLINSPLVFLILAPAGMTFAILRLNRAKPRGALPSAPPREKIAAPHD